MSNNVISIIDTDTKNAGLKIVNLGDKANPDLSQMSNRNI